MFVTCKTRRSFRPSFEITKWEPKNAHDSILPILIINWITGLSVLEYPLGKSRPVFTFIYFLLIQSIYWIITFLDKSMNVDRKINVLEQSIFEVSKYFNIFMATLSAIIDCYYYKVFKTNIRRLELLDEALESMGLSNNYKKMFIDSLLKTVISFVVICILITFHANLSSKHNDLITALKMTYLFTFPHHLNYIVDFTFSSIVNYLGMRFQNINLLLKKNLSNCPNPNYVSELYMVSRLNLSSEYTGNLRDIQLKIRLLILLRYLHMELSQISREINKMYEKQMILSMGIHFTMITGLLYHLFSVIFLRKRSSKDQVNPIINAALWCALYSYRLININFTCARVSLESQKTRNILYELKNTNNDEEFKNEIDQFSSQLTQRPLVFSACGLIILDYSFVRNFIGSVSTYLAILIQFSPEIRK